MEKYSSSKYSNSSFLMKGNKPKSYRIQEMQVSSCSVLGDQTNHNSSPPAINLDQLLHSIQYSINIVKPIKDQQNKDIVIFQGYSGVGKSSSILTLSGEKMISYHHPESKLPLLISKNINGNKGVRIQPQITAGTIYPSYIEVPRNISRNNPVVLWDMPGIGQNRGITQTLINSYFYTRIFEVQQKIKISLLINHNDIDFSQKGNHLEKILTDFMSMFADVEPFKQSLVLIITKCPPLFTKNDALKSFQSIKQKLVFVKNNPKINTFVNHLADQTIPIVIMHRPKISDSLVKAQNAIDVTDQYKDTLLQYYKIVKSLKPSTQIKLQSPLTPSEINKSADLVKKVNQKFTKQMTDLYLYIQIYLNSGETNNQANQKARKLSSMKKFIEEFTKRINKKLKQKKDARNFIRKIQKLLVQFQIPYKNKQKTCPLTIDLRNSLIMINFLNILTFDKTYKLSYQRWSISLQSDLTELDATKMIITFLNDLGVKDRWLKIEETFKKQIESYIVQQYSKHLNEWQNMQIYSIWKQNFKLFPSLSLRLSKFRQAYSWQPEYALKYFKDVQSVEKSCSVNTSKVEDINKLLSFNKNNLNLEVSNNFICTIIIPMVKQKSKQLIQKIVVYDQWEWRSVTDTLNEYAQINALFINQLEKNQPQIDNIDRKAARLALVEAKQKQKQLLKEIQNLKQTQSKLKKQVNDEKGNSMLLTSRNSTIKTLREYQEAQNKRKLEAKDRQHEQFKSSKKVELDKIRNEKLAAQRRQKQLISKVHSMNNQLNEKKVQIEVLNRQHNYKIQSMKKELNQKDEQSMFNLNNSSRKLTDMQNKLYNVTNKLSSYKQSCCIQLFCCCCV